MLKSTYTKKGDENMKIILTERAKELEQTERALYECENKEKQLFADLWLNTDFKKELNIEKNPTEKDKTSWIRTNPDYVEAKRKTAMYKAKARYQERMFNICFEEKYSTVSQ